MIDVALKEWDLVCSALLSGRQAILLRKGGILDSGNHFELEHRRFWLFPTFVHQDPRMVKPEHRAGLTQVRQEPERVQLRGFAEVAGIFAVPDRAAMDRLRDLHVWDEPLIDMRFGYRPEKPLYLVVLRAFGLAEPVEIENTFSYAGCKSWVPLEKGIAEGDALSALGEEKLAAVMERVRAAGHRA